MMVRMKLDNFKNFLKVLDGDKKPTINDWEWNYVNYYFDENKVPDFNNFNNQNSPLLYKPGETEIEMRKIEEQEVLDTLDNNFDEYEDKLINLDTDEHLKSQKIVSDWFNEFLKVTTEQYRIFWFSSRI